MFLDRLHHFMNDRQTPISKLPMVGYKESKYLLMGSLNSFIPPLIDSIAPLVVKITPSFSFYSSLICLNFFAVDLYKFFSKVQRLGGYDGVTANRMWKTVLDEMGGDPANSSAATHSRRHYER